jgi:hypothetical protein
MPTEMCPDCPGRPGRPQPARIEGRCYRCHYYNLDGPIDVADEDGRIAGAEAKMGSISNDRRE